MPEWLAPELFAGIAALLGLGGGGEMWRRGRKSQQQALVESTQRRTGRIERSLDALEPLIVAIAEKSGVSTEVLVEAKVLLNQVDREATGKGMAVPETTHIGD